MKYSIKRIRETFLPRGGAQRGFTLLIAALVASIVLALGAAIFGIASKQVTLSSLGRDSQYAFYAADNGAECALYWDERYQFFGTTTPSYVAPPLPSCDGQSLLGPNFVASESGQPYTLPYTEQFQFQPEGNCAKVTVEKCDGPIASNGLCCDAANAGNNACSSFSSTQLNNTSIHTRIHADGYSTSCNTIATSPVALQRSVELNY